MRSVAVFVPVLVGIVSPLAAQGPVWLLRTTAAAPALRYGHAIAYDSVRQRVVMFGGTTGTALLSDTQLWDGGNGAWQSPWPSVHPSSRRDHAMVFDSARQCVLLFGGALASGSSAQTWEWNGTAWSLRSPAASPPARSEFAMAFDSTRQRVVLFGGLGTTGSDLADTWEWDGATWVATFPTTFPSARHGHAMAYDSARQCCVLFGGSSGGNETWEWNGLAWALRTPAASPPPRRSHAMVFDSTTQRVVLFGGTWGSDQTWEWDGAMWIQTTPNPSPLPRWSHALAFDASRQRTVLFGGLSYNQFVWGDTWDYRGPLVLASASPFGAGCGTPPMELLPDASARPLLGQAGGATITHAPTTVAAVALGTSNETFGPYQLPVTLAGIGMTGCFLLQSSDVMGIGTTPVSASTLATTIAIPNAPALLDAHVFLQAYAWAPAVNALEIVASNAIDWRLGNL